MRRLVLLLFLLAAAAAAQTFPTGRGRWTVLTNEPSDGQYEVRHATLLRDGRVAVTGDASGTIGLYDPATNQLSPGPADKRRGHPSATLLLDGRVLIAGGSGADRDCALYDPVAGTVTPTGSMAYPRANHEATLLPDGRVLVTGGAYIQQPGWLPTGQKPCEIYDPATGSWSPAGTLLVARFAHTATLLPDGNVLVYAGDRGFESHGSVELYSPRTGISTMVDPDHRGRVEHRAIVARDGLVYFLGGGGPSSIAESYDPATGTFSAEFPVIQQTMPAAALMPDGRILMVGEQLVWLDPATRRSVATARPPVSFGTSPSAVALQDGRLFVAGDDTAAVFDPGGPRMARGDLDGDYRADVLWHQPATGRHTLWQMHGVQAASMELEPYTATAGGFSWRMETLADPDGGGIMEAIWRGTANRYTALGWNSGLAVNPVDELGLASTLPEWSLAAAADCSGDGREDFVARGPSGDVKIVGLGHNVPVEFFRNRVADPNFIVAAADDFDGDGTADILWRHLLRGENYIWFMGGARWEEGSVVVARAGHTTPVADMNYSVVGTGDFDGDGKADIVWRSVFGPTRIWFMNGVTVANDVAVPAPGAGWNAAVIGDFDDDGKSDVFWRNPTTGENEVTLFDGWNVKASSSLPAVTEAGWITMNP